MVLCAPALIRYPKEHAPVSCPTVVIHGAQDEITDFAATKAIALKIGADFVEVQDMHRLAGSMSNILIAFQNVFSKTTVS
jgi:hypothetical protein